MKITTDQIMLNFFKTILKVFTYIVVIPCLFMILSLTIKFKIEDDRRYQERWNQSLKADREQFPHLADPIFYFSRRHGGDWGASVMVYPLNEKTKRAFLKQWQLNKAKSVEQIECIRPTVKKRWKTWHSNIHYVVSDPWLQLLRQERFRDSFIVFGSDKYLKNVEQACQEPIFKKLEQAAPRYGNPDYWAVVEEQRLLFSVKHFY